jgi:hypothetical protein
MSDDQFETHIKSTAWYGVLSQAANDDDDGASVFRMARMAAHEAWNASRYQIEQQAALILSLESRIAQQARTIAAMCQQVADLKPAVAPAVDAQPVGVAGAMPGTDGFTMAAFKASEVPVGTPLYASAQSDGWKKDAVPDGVEIASYCLTEYDDVIIQRVMQIAGPDLWAVRHAGSCLGKDGEWEYEPMPSSRNADFLSRCRFESAKEAIDAALSRHKSGEKDD